MNLNHKYLSVIPLIVFLIFILMKIPLYSEMYSTVTGEVIDEVTGKGIAGVTVIIDFRDGSRTLGTDSNGEFISTEIEPGKLKIVYLPPPPYALPPVNKKYDIVMLERGKNLHIVKKLEYGGTIEGRVYEKNSNEPLKIDMIWLQRQFAFALKKKSNGEYRIDQIKPGKHTIYVNVVGVGVREINELEIHPNETIRLDFPFDSNALTKVVGKVTCKETGVPFINMEIVLFSNSNQLFSYSYTNENGEYSFIDVLPGEYRIVVRGVNREKDPNNLIIYEKKIIVMKDKKAVGNFIVDCSLEYVNLKGEK